MVTDSKATSSYCQPLGVYSAESFSQWTAQREATELARIAIDERRDKREERKESNDDENIGYWQKDFGERVKQAEQICCFQHLKEFWPQVSVESSVESSSRKFSRTF